MSNTSSKSSEQSRQQEIQGHLCSGLPFTVGAAQWHASSWASLKPKVKPGLPTPVQDKMQAKTQDNPTQSSSISSHQFLKEE
jgi:hypothetical protein